MVPGYEVKIVTESVNGSMTILRGVRCSDGLPVVIKWIRKDQRQASAALGREYDTLLRLNMPGVIRAHELLDLGDTTALVLDSVDGRPLAEYIERGTLPLRHVLGFAEQVAEVLGQLHDEKIVVQNINPSAIVWDQERLDATLFDYGDVRFLGDEEDSRSDQMTGDPAYMAPEQSGRTSWIVDHRSDLYALGVTLYEALTGRHPFPFEDTAEIIHAHLAREPEPLHDIWPTIPPVISDIIMKLLEKNPEDRYQSASGLRVDLKHCLGQIGAGEIVDSFLLGRGDTPDQLRYSSQLYGRSGEINDLHRALAEIDGHPGLVLVSGYSGVGKTVLIEGVLGEVSETVVSGKFDQFANRPYTALIQAFQMLTDMLLSEREQDVVLLKDRLVDALGSNGRVLVDMIPEIEALIGEQPAVPTLSSEATQIRLHIVMQSFARVVSETRRLILFLDDIQWADQASILMLKDLSADPDLGGLTVIGAYRDNEVGDAHPLIEAQRALIEEGARVPVVRLLPLEAPSVFEMISDTLGEGTDEVRGLSEDIHEKTMGNPFYVRILLQSLHQMGQLAYDEDDGMWRYDRAGIGELDVTENVAEFLTARFGYLPASVLGVLQVAACLGNRFDLDLLVRSVGLSRQSVAEELDRAQALGLIVPLGERSEGDESSASYRFVHDRVQEAAVGTLSAKMRSQMHREIGQQMLAVARETSTLDACLIDVVQHLNRGQSQITGLEESLELAELNLQAARSARASAAFDQTYAFHSDGIGLLPEDCWQKYYDLTLALHEGAVEAAYLCGDSVGQEALHDVILDRAKTDLDKVKAFETQILALVAENQPKDAVRVGLQVLEMLDISIPEEPEADYVERENAGVLSLLDEKSDAEILGQLHLQDPAHRAVLRIINGMMAPAIQLTHPSTILLIGTHVRISLTYGHSVHSSIGYAFYGMIWAGNPVLMNTSNRLGTLAQTINEQMDARESCARVDLPVYAIIKPWIQPLGEVLGPMRLSIDAGKEVGDIEFAGRLMTFYCTLSILAGQELTALDEEVVANGEFMTRHGLTAVRYWNGLQRQFGLNLLGRSRVPHELSGEGFDEGQSLQSEIEGGNRNVLYMIHLYKLILCYLHRKFDDAVQHAQTAEPYLDGCPGMIFTSFLPFYESLSLLAVYKDREPSEQEGILDKVAENQEKIKVWAEFGPANQLYKYHLVEAECARVEGRDLEAAELYDRAIELAGEHGYINDEAMANEVAARFYEGCGRMKFAQVYIQDAYRLYELWGAKAKTDDLLAQYPQWLDAQVSSSLERSGSLDVDAIVKVSRTFSEVPIARDMLQQMMKIVMENGGAERAVLLLHNQGGWVLEAEARPDGIEVLQSVQIDLDAESVGPLSHRVVSYVVRTQTGVVLNEALADARFGEDPYLVELDAKSVCCLPLLHLGDLMGLLYLENNLVTGAFTEQRSQVLEMLGAQLGVALRQARQYDEQLQHFQYLYHMRTMLSNARTVAAMMEGLGQLVVDTLGDASGVDIMFDGQAWSHGVLGGMTYERTLVLEERDRGRVCVCCSSALSENQERMLLDETVGQLSQALIALDLEAQLLRSARLVSMGEMAAGVAHELNQPLAAISATAGDVQLRLVEGVTLTEDELKSMMGDVVNWSQRLGETVDHLRVFSRDHSEEPGILFSLHEVIESGLRLIGAQLANHNIEVSVDLGRDNPVVEGHPHQIEQVVVNLLGNAKDAVDLKRDAKRVAVRVTVEGSRAVVEVEDNGAGVDEADAERIFEPFFTTKDAEHGTGLGLSISYAIVKHHGGDLTCSSRSGEGAVFQMVLPINP